jgi:hypothetical protein
VGEAKRRRQQQQQLAPPSATARPLQIAIRRGLDKEAVDRTREESVHHLLWWLLSNLKAKLDPAQQRNLGLPEIEAFFEALVSGGEHPALKGWESRKGGHPPPAAHEWRARRLIVLLSVALKRSGWNRSMEETREFAAKEATRAEVFAEVVTAKAIRKWEERQPALTPADEQLLATAIACCGVNAPHNLAKYFIGLAHFVHNPSAMVVR